MKVSLVIPTYNEAENLPRLLGLLNEVLIENFELIVVDDGSPDGTGQLAEALSEKFPIKVIHRQEKMGLASAAVEGFKAAGGDVLGVMDADFQHPPQKIQDMLEEISRGAEVAIASRYVPGGRIEGWSLIRRLISRGATALAHIFLPSTKRVEDPLSGFFLFRRRVLEDVELQPTGYKILLELLVKGNYNRLVEVPYTFSARKSGKSKLNLKEQTNYLKHMFSLISSPPEQT